MDKTYVYLVVCFKRREGWTEDWVSGAFFNKDRAEACLQLLRDGNLTDGAHILEEEILDARVGVS